MWHACFGLPKARKVEHLYATGVAKLLHLHSGCNVQLGCQERHEGLSLQSSWQTPEFGSAGTEGRGDEDGVVELVRNSKHRQIQLKQSIKRMNHKGYGQMS